MKKYIILSLAALAMLSGCKKEQGGEANSFTATIEQSAAKTTLGTDRYPNWESTDRIVVNRVTCTTSTGRISGTTASFIPATTVSADGEMYYAYYPASLYNSSEQKYILPDTQTYVANTIRNLPMYAAANTNTLQFKNLCGVLAVKVSSTAAGFSTLKKIRVSASNHNLCGEFTVQGDSAVINNSGSDVHQYVVLDLGTEGVTLTTEVSTFYIAIPAHIDYEMLKIELSSNGTSYSTSMTTTATSAISIARNSVNAITFRDNHSSIKCGMAMAWINNDSVPVKWVQLWSNGPKWATINVGQTLLDYNLAPLTSTADLSDVVSPYYTVNVGGLYCWGNTENRRQSRTNTNHSTNGSDIQYTSDDIAKNIWGPNWQMPTCSQMNEVSSHCDFSFGDHPSAVSNIIGTTVTGRDDYAGNTMFLPAGGVTVVSENNGQVSAQGSNGTYWSSTRYPHSNVYGASIYNNNGTYINFSDCGFTDGRSVRAILHE